MVLIFPLEVVQVSFLIKFFVSHLISLNCWFWAFWRRLGNWGICLCWCNTISFSFYKLLVDMTFLSIFLEFWQLSFGLSIKSTYEIEWSKVTQWNGAEEFWEKTKVFGSEWQIVFFTCSLLIPEQILWLNIPLIRLDVFFTFSIDFMV